MTSKIGALQAVFEKNAIDNLSLDGGSTLYTALVFVEIYALERDAHLALVST